jgi:DnaJ-class molecular chaperone
MKEKKLVKPIEVKPVSKEVLEDRSAYNCPTCKGSGLQDEKTLCPACHGTGKV